MSDQPVRVRVLPHDRFKDGVCLNTPSGAAAPGDTVTLSPKDAHFAVGRGWAEVVADDEEEAEAAPVRRGRRGAER
jgi:hypothetical protein